MFFSGLSSGARLRRHRVQLKRTSGGFDVVRAASEYTIYTCFSSELAEYMQNWLSVDV